VLPSLERDHGQKGPREVVKAQVGDLASQRERLRVAARGLIEIAPRVRDEPEVPERNALLAAVPEPSVASQRVERVLLGERELTAVEAEHPKVVEDGPAQLLEPRALGCAERLLQQRTR